jgi:hypothetical protein
MRDRLNVKKSQFRFWNPTNIILLSAFAAILATSGFYTASFVFSYVSSASTSMSISSHPASIPWLDNEAKCKHTHRTWHNGKCWDSEHNLLF